MKNLSECDGCIGGVPTLDTTLGVGNAVPPQMAAMTAAEQTSSLSHGSGDLFGSKIKKSPKKKRKKYVIGKKTKSKFIKLSESYSYETINKKLMDLNDCNCKIYSINVK